jgi:hypothetical protein
MSRIIYYRSTWQRVVMCSNVQQCSNSLGFFRHIISPSGKPLGYQWRQNCRNHVNEGACNDSHMLKQLGNAGALAEHVFIRAGECTVQGCPQVLKQELGCGHTRNGPISHK